MKQLENAPDNTTGQGAPDERIGHAVRSLREQQGLSVRSLAKLAGFSASFISQIERGLASPSIASMEKIALALGVSLSEFFASKGERSDLPVIVRAGEGEELTSAWSHASLRALSPSWDGRKLSPVVLTLAPGGRSGSEPVGHVGEEFAFVLAGAVQLHLQSETRVLTAGDAVHLIPETPHRWENMSTRDAQVLLVSS